MDEASEFASVDVDAQTVTVTLPYLNVLTAMALSGMRLYLSTGYGTEQDKHTVAQLEAAQAQLTEWTKD